MDKVGTAMLAQGVVAQSILHRLRRISSENGSITVRFRPAALRDLRDTITAALHNHQLQQPGESNAPDPRPERDVH